jgi:hypothetical protein
MQPYLTLIMLSHSFRLLLPRGGQPHDTWLKSIAVTLAQAELNCHGAVRHGWPDRKRKKDFAGSDDTASMIKEGVT